MGKKIKLFEDEEQNNDNSQLSPLDNFKNSCGPTDNKNYASQNFDIDSSFFKKQLEGRDGHLLLQMQKGYKGDSRFKLDSRFEGDLDLSRHKLTDAVKGSLSNLETNQMLSQSQAPIVPASEIDSEKANAFNILSQIVPAAEVYFQPSSSKRKQSMTIKRFNPLSKSCSHLLKSQPVVKAAEPEDKIKIVSQSEWKEKAKSTKAPISEGPKSVQVAKDWLTIGKKHTQASDQDFVLDFGDDSDKQEASFHMGIKFEAKTDLKPQSEEYVLETNTGNQPKQKEQEQVQEAEETGQESKQTKHKKDKKTKKEKKEKKEKKNEIQDLQENQDAEDQHSQQQDIETEHKKDKRDKKDKKEKKDKKDKKEKNEKKEKKEKKKKKEKKDKKEKKQRKDKKKKRDVEEEDGEQDHAEEVQDNTEMVDQVQNDLIEDQQKGEIKKEEQAADNDELAEKEKKKMERKEKRRNKKNKDKKNEESKEEVKEKTEEEKQKEEAERKDFLLKKKAKKREKKRRRRMREKMVNFTYEEKIKMYMEQYK